MRRLRWLHAKRTWYGERHLAEKVEILKLYHIAFIDASLSQCSVYQPRTMC